MANNIIETNRICYVDPNDIRGSIKNEKNELVPVTPDYTDMCIWCNLIVEPSSRLKNQGDGKNDEGDTFISYDFTVKGSNVSFMQGKDAEQYNFLTTDYTNIDFEEIRHRNIIEGLQIESINIAFTNYQTPQVTIKFIDIRGGGFFGREEATHNEYGKLSNLELDRNNNIFDNFFSCFVSFPYPRFKLQVKGFYGKPVTFQLTCTNFNGRFNSQTGNFEITVQFIGYEYGVLGDIPFDLLIAAPLTGAGEVYWNSQCKDLEKSGWGLGKDNTPPLRLYDFYQKISSELQPTKEDETKEERLDELENSVADDSRLTQMEVILEEKAKLGEIKLMLNKIKQCINNTFDPSYVTHCENDQEDVIIIYNKTEKFEFTNKLVELCKLHNDLALMVNDYNTSYEDDISDIISNTWIEKHEKQEWKPSDVEFTEFMEHKDGGDRNKKEGHVNNIIALNSEDKSLKKPITDENSCIDYKIGKFYSSDWYTISKGVSKKIYEDLSTRNWSIYGVDGGRGLSFAKYAVAFDFGNTHEQIDNKLTQLTKIYDEYRESLMDMNNKSITELVGFAPYIGDYFKVVMCHLETLVYLFNVYADMIYEQMDNDKRTPANLGIRSLEVETDVPSEIKNVPPFPSVYKKYRTDEEAMEQLNTGKDIVTNAWIGDFKGKTPWLEKQFVEEIYEAAERIKADRKTDDEVLETTSNNYDSLNPIDYYFPIPNYAYTTFDGLKLYAGLRAYITAYMMVEGNWKFSEKFFEDLGMYDGYIYTTKKPDNVMLKNVTGGRVTHADLYDGVVYTENFKNNNPLLYEFSKEYKDRQPVFIKQDENGGNSKYLEYNFMRKKGTGDEGNCNYIPLDNFLSVKKVGFNKYTHTPGEYDWAPQNKTQSEFLFSTEVPNFIDNYKDTHMFEIKDDPITIRKIKYTWDNFKKGNINIAGKTSKELLDTLSKFVLLDDDRYKEFYEIAPDENFNTYNDLGINIEALNDDVKNNKTNEIKNKFLKLKN